METKSTATQRYPAFIGTRKYNRPRCITCYVWEMKFTMFPRTVLIFHEGFTWESCNVFVKTTYNGEIGLILGDCMQNIFMKFHSMLLSQILIISTASATETYDFFSVAAIKQGHSDDRSSWRLKSAIYRNME